MSRDSAARVRPAEPGDYPAIGALSVAAYQHDGQFTAGTEYYRTVLADVASRASAGTVLVAVDERDGSVLGAVTFVLPGSPMAELSREGEAEFRTLAVDPAAQGRGIGRALVCACLDRARQAGARAVVICTRDTSTPAHRLYERLGFRRTPELDWSPVSGVRLLALRYDL